MWSNATLIAGPTASGKSAYAIDIARQKDGVIINADSMQVYDVLRILTARPDDHDLEQVPHYLYGHKAPSDDYSTGHWLSDVSQTLQALDKDLHVVFVGGTGLYFKALLGGLSPMPAIDNTLREHWRSRLREEGPQELHRLLQSRDPAAAEMFETSDGQRIVRALEVLEESGKSIVYWQKQPGIQLVDPETTEQIVLEPDRSALRERIDRRFDQMVETGAIEEVKALNALKIPNSMPAMKSIGVPQIRAYLAGTLPLGEAIERSKTSTRQYAKRQSTWFRNQLDEKWRRVSA